MVKCQVSLDTFLFKALRLLAEQEFRDPRAQAALIIRRELERASLLKSDRVHATQSQPAQEPKQGRAHATG